MSSHFSANQFESAFSPQRLQNYQVPAKHKKHPSLRKGKTAIISNDRGHLISSVRQSTASPWGSFVGTWQAERKPLNIKTKPKIYRTLEQSGPISRLSTRASSAPPASVRCNNGSQAANVTSPTPTDPKSPVPVQSGLPVRTEVRSPSNTNTRPTTVGSVRFSAQGSRVYSPAASIRSPTPTQCSRASSARGSVTIPSPSLIVERELGSSSPKPETSRPQSPLQSEPQSRLHTPQDCDTTAQT